MHSRRNFLAIGLRVGAVMVLASACVARAASDTTHIKAVTAITQVFGDGQKLSALGVEYDCEIDNSRLLASAFEVPGRTVLRVYANTVNSPAMQGRDGKYVIVELSPNDPAAVLYARERRTLIRKKATASVLQAGTVHATDGTLLAAGATPVASQSVRNLIVDDFRQFEYKDPKTGDLLKYNLFIPRNYDKNKSYPLVLFMHDAGATSTEVETTLVQGLGAVVWASPADQARHEAFVLAPQYSTQVVNDDSEASSYLETTVDLLEALAGTYRIDRNRLYATGQSGGAMMSIAMNIKYPGLFAASFIVAGQWDPQKVQPLAGDKLWIMVSEGDLKAYPGENAITAQLERHGAKISRAVWNGDASPGQFALAVQAMKDEGNAINYVMLKKGTVVPPGQDDNGGGNHTNTWRIAYNIDGIRDWIFQQHK